MKLMDLSQILSKQVGLLIDMKDVQYNYNRWFQKDIKGPSAFNSEIKCIIEGRLVYDYKPITMTMSLPQ